MNLPCQKAERQTWFSNIKLSLPQMWSISKLYSWRLTKAVRHQNSDTLYIRLIKHKYNCGFQSKHVKLTFDSHGGENLYSCTNTTANLHRWHFWRRCTIIWLQISTVWSRYKQLYALLQFFSNRWALLLNSCW